MECWLTFSNCLGVFREWFVRLFRITKSSWVLILWIHCNRCLFYSIADYHNNDYTWLGTLKEDHNSDLNKYIAAIYLATTTVTIVRFGDLHPVNKGERLLCIIIMILNIGFDAYFIYSLKYIVSPVRPLPFLGELEMSPPPLLICFQPRPSPSSSSEVMATQLGLTTQPDAGLQSSSSSSEVRATQLGLATQLDAGLQSSSSASHVDQGTSLPVQQSAVLEIELVD